MAYNYEFPYTDPNRYNDDWLLRNVKSLIKDVEGLEEWKTEHEEQYLQLKALYDDIISGNFPQSVTDAFNEWMRANAYDLVGEMVRLVFFGITDDGYFVAYIPEYWSDIIFNTTGYDINVPGFDFGHLVLSFEVGGN